MQPRKLIYYDVCSVYQPLNPRCIYDDANASIPSFQCRVAVECGDEIQPASDTHKDQCSYILERCFQISSFRFQPSAPTNFLAYKSLCLQKACRTKNVRREAECAADEVAPVVNPSILRPNLTRPECWQIANRSDRLPQSFLIIALRLQYLFVTILQHINWSLANSFFGCAQRRQHPRYKEGSRPPKPQ